MLSETEVGSQLKDLVQECMTIGNGLKEVGAIILAMIPPWMWKYHFKEEMPFPQEEQKELKEKGRSIGGWEEVNKRYDSIRKEYDERVSILAGMLEEEDFEIDRLKGDLTEEQISWINSHMGEIKQHLSGVEII